ncbi:MAG: PVC-type heme-binding CxxCH protein, partial [Verrucomicrobiota bacterium]
MRSFHLTVALLSWLMVANGAEFGPIRVLFLGHESEQHNSNLYYPMLAKALGPDAIYFDYVTTPEAAFADADHLARYDAVLMYCNHKTIERAHWKNLKSFVEEGGGFVPVHSASWCFQNILEFDQLVGGRFKSHQSGVFSPTTVLDDHPAMQGVPKLEAWDETYFHINHNPRDRTVLQVREPMPGDPHTEPEPWTWVRNEGMGRVFYTASGHDERVWSQPEFHALLKSGIIWSVGDSRAETYQSFLANRAPLKYEKRANIPNYERPEPLDYQLPLSPEASLDYTQVPVGWKLELFAAEPDIINPIYMAWDERGRLWVAETVDYPNEVRPQGGNDKIKILEDTDGDGRCDKVTVFAEGLNIPTSLTFADGGIIVAQAPDFLFLKDTDGDDKADVRRVMFSGWGVKDTHAGPSNLRYGFDNWIWGAVGYSSFNGEMNGEKKQFGSGIYRFKPDGSELEFVAQFNNNTWGLGFNAAGDAFGSTANRNPSFFCGIPQSVYGTEKRMSAKMIASSADFHPITPNIRQVDAFGLYTAGAGHALATSANFPSDWQNRSAFVCGPTGNLVGRFQISPDGAGFVAKNEFSLVASVDEWFSPVAAEVGPDGNLWIADWYNFIIQHNPTPRVERGGYDGERGIGNAHVNPNRDKQHGRIYRLVREGAVPSKITSLEGASTEQLIAALDNDNLHWRSMAQRLLVERADTSAVITLREKVKSTGVAAIHALWALEGMDELDRETHQYALLSPNSGLKRNAIKALGTDPDAFQLFFDSAVVADKDPQVRLVAFAKLASFPKSEMTERAAGELLKLPENREDEW